MTLGHQTTFIPPTPRPLPRPSVGKRTRRGLQTVAVLARHLGPPLLRRVARRPVPEADVVRGLRRAFEDLGATFVKFGQLVGSSPGAFGPGPAGEFRSCLDTGPAVPFDQVRAIVEEDLGAPLLELFTSFDHEPLAAASIAVVHRATLLDGSVAAVKVLRPGIAETVTTDLDLMGPLFGMLARQGIGVAATLYQFVSGFRSQVAEELDLRNEARTMDFFGALFAAEGFDLLVVPVPHHDLTGPRVLTMEFLDGVPIDDIDAIAGFGADPRPVAEQMLRAWLFTALRNGVFHGDIHAGNLLLLRDARLGIVDWGIVGVLDDEVKGLFRRFVEAVLGDETAWDDISAFFEKMNVERPSEDERRENRDRITKLLSSPFGEVSLSGALSGPVGETIDRSLAGRIRRLRRTRRLVRSATDNGYVDSGFGRADFMLFKQLLYFERYGKMYLADRALLGDHAWLEQILERDREEVG